MTPTADSTSSRLRARKRLGKYRIRRRVAEGGFGIVFAAHDTIEGTDVALKVPNPSASAEDLRREIRLVSRLDHPNVLGIRNADQIEGHFVVAYPLGRETLSDRLTRRMSLDTAMYMLEQMLCALAHAHARGIVHCDVKPENMILFDDDVLRLTDFGIARATTKTLDATAAGSLGYLAPEQALGRPSPRSDVFSAGMVIHRVLGGRLPSWPFDWPFPDAHRLARVPGLPELVRKATQLDTRRRFRDADAMLTEFRRCRKRLQAKQAKRVARSEPKSSQSRSWRRLRFRQFRRTFGSDLRLDHACASCHEPVDERMTACPWCAASPLHAEGKSSFPASCPRCERGMKLDWRYCPWCWGPKLAEGDGRRWSDRRYRASCHSCHEKVLMPFMRYCPRCHAKVRKAWRLGKKDRACRKCGNGVAPTFWSACAWCSADV